MRAEMNSLLSRTLLLALALTVSACAVTPGDIEAAKAQKTQDIQAAMMGAKTKLRQESRMTFVKGNYLGDSPIDLPYAASLPESFFEMITLRPVGTAYGSVAQAAKNISLATGIPVRVNADVTAGTNASPSAPPMPTPLSTLTAKASELPSNHRHLVRLNFNGTLHAYLKDIASTAGIEWEYKDGGIHFYRMVTKNFTLSNLSPGDITLSDVMNKGAQSSLGQKGGESASNTGSFSSASSVGTNASYSIWKMLDTSLKSALSPEGKLLINEGTGTVTVTDTKDALHKIEKLIEEENAKLGKQILIDVRVVRLDINKESQAGLDLNTVLAAFSNSGALAKTLTTVAPGSQTSATAGTVTFVAKKPIYLGQGSEVAVDAGSAISTQALNQFGSIMADSTSSVITTNRVPAMTGAFKTYGFLAATTPASGGATGGGTGVPGLTPGAITTGSFLRVLPTIRDNNTILLSMSVDISDLLGMGSASTGSGATQQQIQWANTSGTKTISNLLLRQEESMVMVGIGGDTSISKSSNSLTGASATGATNRTMFVVVVTPRILKNL